MRNESPSSAVDAPCANGFKFSFVLPGVHDIVASAASRAPRLPDKNPFAAPVRGCGVLLASSARFGAFFRATPVTATVNPVFRSFYGVAPRAFIFRVGKCQNHCIVSFADS
jgi:hypothetical protein